MNRTTASAVALAFVLLTSASSVDAAQPAAPKPTTFNELVAKARASNRTVTKTLEATAPEIIKAQEAAFLKRFGFPVRIESQPGHHRDVPMKVVESAKSGRGVVDMWDGGTPLVLGMFRAGNTRRPPWEAVYEGFPLAKKLRAAVPSIGGAPDGSVLSDHCMFMQNTSWTLAYNTKRVKAAELKGIKLEDLTGDPWRNRVVWDAKALGIYALPFATGWDVERMRVFAHNLGANGVKLAAGGSMQIIESLAQGEGDISMATMNWVTQHKSLGAPIDIAFAEFVLGNITVNCLMNPGVNEANMAALYWAWETFDGAYVEAKITGGGIFRLFQEEEKYLPLTKLARQHGITSPDQVVGPKTEEDAEKSAEYRKIAIEALKAGITSKKKISR